MTLADLARIDPDDLLRRVQAEKCRRSLAEFVRHGWQALEPGIELAWNWHIPFLCDHIQAVLEDWMKRQRDPSYVQRCRNLLINVPPGTAKSRITSVFAPAWMWLHWPSWRVLCLSANPDIALRDGDLSKQLIESEWYREWFEPEWEVRQDQEAKSNYGNTARGQRISKGIRAKIIGVRTDAIIVDDPNDMKEVHSEAIRKSVNYSWDHAIANRVNDLRSSVRIGIMQRGHENDWSGHVLDKGGWEHICIPMEFEPERAAETFLGQRDPRTEPGEILHPERFTPEVLADEVRRGSFYYAGQFQQRPVPAGGGLFRRDWFGFVEPDELPKFDEVTLSLDCASKKTTDGSNTAILAMGAKGPRRYVLECIAGHWTQRETAERALRMREKWGAGKVLVEDKAAGPGVVETLKEVITGVVSVQVAAGESKESRAMAVQPDVEAGDVALLRGQWNDEFLHELCTFPLGVRDDRVDAFTQATNHLRGGASALALFKAMAS